MRHKLVDNATWTRKASSALRYEEARVAAAPPRARGDDRAALIAELIAEPDVRVLWHASDGGGIDAPIHEWQACAIDSKNCGRDWSHGSGFYLVHFEDQEVPTLATHYRAVGDREDPRPTSGRQDPDAEFRRMQAEFWGRMRSEAADQEQKIKSLGASLDAAQQTIATHLGTIARKDERIAALESDRIPQAPEEHWAAPIMSQVAGMLEEFKPYAGPAIRDLAPLVRAAAQEHLSEGAYAIGLSDRLEKARTLFDRLLPEIAAVSLLPDGFALRIPEPADEAVLTHHCPLKDCEAERGEPCMDETGHPCDPHCERRALARVPREARAALRKFKIEAIDLSALVPPPGATVASDATVLATVAELAAVLELDDAWREREAQKAAAAVALSEPESTPDPAPAPEPSPAPPVTPAVATPPPVIPDAEIEEDAAEPPPRRAADLSTPEARADFAARAAERAIPLAETPEAAARAAGLAEARRAARAKFQAAEAQRAELETKRAAESTEEPSK